MMMKTEAKNANYTLIDSRKFFIKRICGYIVAGIDILLGGMIFSRGASRNFLSRFVDIPYGIEILLYVLVFILLGIAVSLIVNKEKDKGKIQFDTDYLELAGKEINLADTPVTVSLNASKEKGIYERTIKDGGGNNWVEFIKDGKPEKYEFLIPSQKKEKELTGLIDEYWKKGFKVELKSSSPSFWEKLSF
jgi:hypothetical protein